MATVNKDFRIKAGLVVEGANATVNGEDVITTGSTTDDLAEGSSNLYFTAQRAAEAVADEIDTAVSSAINALDTDDIEEGATNKYFTNQRALDATSAAYDPAGSAATAEQNANDYTDTAIGNLPANFITSTTTEFSVTDGELSLDQLNGSTQINPASGLQPNNGYATIEYTDTDSGTEGLKIKSERGWVGSQIGGQLDVDAYRDVVITSRNGDIVLNADGDTYLGSVASGNDIATTGYVDGLASNYDPAGSAATAESNANTYTDTAINGLDTDDIEEGPTNLYFTNQRALDATAAAYDAAGAAATAESNANTYTDTALEDYTPTSSLDATVGGYGYLKSADLSGYATETYVNNAVADLVDGAPALLDTLNELAAALEDNPDVIADLRDIADGKQNTLTAGTNISIVADTISVTGLDTDDVAEGTNLYFTNQRALDATSAAYDVAGAAAAAQTAAESYADSLASNYEAAGAAQAAVDALDTDDIEEGLTNLYFTDERAVDAVSGSDIYPNAVIINNVSKNVATTQTVASASTVSALTWNKSDYKSAKLVVKAKTASHSQVSEIIVTLDASDNVAITEFGIVYTDEELATVTADVVLNDVRIRVTTLNASTDVTVVGMLLL